VIIIRVNEIVGAARGILGVRFQQHCGTERDFTKPAKMPTAKTPSAKNAYRQNSDHRKMPTGKFAEFLKTNRQPPVAVGGRLTNGQLIIFHSPILWSIKPIARQM
jgi:hypothetical protein